MTQTEPILPKEKAIVYVLRRVQGRLEVLVFDHIDYPDVNRQVPGGGIKPEESKEKAALRELEEESGIMNARLIRYLGEREAGTERLEAAVDAYQQALLERTRERVPLDWAGTQNNLGTALRTQRDSATGTES